MTTANLHTPPAANKLTSRDLITTAIFSVLFIVVLFIAASIMGMLPITMIFYGALSGIPCGIIYMYMRAKAPKRGTIMIQAILVAAICFLMGTFWTFAAGTVIGGILAELISSRGGYVRFWKNTIGYVVFMSCIWVGQMLPIAMAKDIYLKFALESGMSAQYMETMMNYLNLPVFLLGLCVTAVFALLGALLGRKLLNKHFVKAGIV